MVRRLLVANRGEIAVRIIRAARELGVRTIAVYSDADAEAVHVRLADEAVHIGPAQASRSYLDTGAVLAAVRSSGADSVHPGYGFLSERAEFAEGVLESGAAWVGPSPQAIRSMGDKAEARRSAQEAGVPIVPGTDGPVASAADAVAAAEAVGFPVAIKASAGGGGRGIRIVGSRDDLAGAVAAAQAEARAAFGSDEVYLERFVPRARHIEVQVFGDGENFVHVGVRECSMQRRRQKMIEEAGAATLPAAIAAEMETAAVALAESVKYTGAGTVEFLYDEASGEFFFIEMNTRIQVEHPVTEMISGLDLVQEQLRIAFGERLSFTQDDVVLRGHALEVRINAENPDRDFLPSPGTVTHLQPPGGPFVRFDSGFTAGSTVPPYYDSLLAKLVVWAGDRGRAVERMLRALDELQLEGLATTAGFVRRLVDTPEFRAGEYHTTFLEQWMQTDRAEAGVAHV
ncbi:acetyl-CoA carboxylase biotin carboxylase subunit [Trujillonella humicola]|uniref:acetyl-CoA carboxylase biotin carboxylase subunit n=1 Tax=Trujillonella humicola TaxID=3383699 RepID=UPI0039068C4D